MHLTARSCRMTSIAAIAVMIAAAPAFSQTPVPASDLRLPPPGSIKVPAHPIPPGMEQKPDNTPEPPVAEFPLTLAQLQFADQYIRAVNDSDSAAMRKLIAPKSLACFNKDNEVFLDEWIGRQLRDQIAKPYKLSVEQIDPAEFIKTKLFTLPLAPTHQLDIATKVNGRAVTIGRPIVYQDGRWYEIAPCPTDLGLRHTRRRIMALNEQRQHAIDLYNSLPEAFRKNLYQLLLQDRGEEACRQTSERLKVDLKTGCRVADVLWKAMNEAAEKAESTATPKGAAAK